MSLCEATAYQRKDRGGTMPARFWVEYRCSNPAKWTAKRHGETTNVCGVHVKKLRRYGYRVTERRENK